MFEEFFATNQHVIYAIIGLGTLYISYMTYKNLKYKKDKPFWDLLNKNYNKVIEARRITFGKGAPTMEAFKLISDAWAESKLYLPPKIEKYLRKSQDKFRRAYCLEKYINNKQNDQNRRKWLEEQEKLVNDIFEEKPDKIYRKYMTIEKS